MVIAPNAPNTSALPDTTSVDGPGPIASAVAPELYPLDLLLASDVVSENRSDPAVELKQPDISSASTTAPGTPHALVDEMNALLCLLSLTAAIPVTVPEKGPSEPVTVGPLKIAFSLQGSLMKLEIAGLTAAERAAGTFTVAPVVKQGTFTTRRLDGERFKCLPQAEVEKWITDEHLELPATRVKLSEASLGPTTFSVPLTRFVSQTTRQLQVSLSIPRGKTDFLLELTHPLEIYPLAAELLRQSQKVGPSLLTFTPRGLELTRVSKDVCGDQALLVQLFDDASLQVLAYPTPDSRMFTAHGWVFAEKFDPSQGIPPLAITGIDARNVTFLGEPYDRRLARVEVTPGRAVAIFELGDFAGCFGASCGDPVNVREAHVKLENGVLSTKLVRNSGTPR